MKELETAHRERPWRVHAIAHDFHLEDMWSLDLGGRRPEDIRDFLATFWSTFRVLADGKLARARLWIGDRLRWDDHDLTIPIPGCTETTVSARLSADDRGKSLVADDTPSPVASPKVKTVYVFPDEAVYEFSNDTIHGLLHLALVGDRATLAVYVKHRGLKSRLYMAAIWPARHLIVYPAFLRKLEGVSRASK